jgi:hypothetical protein
VASRIISLFPNNSDNNDENEDDFASSQAMEAAVNAKFNIDDLDTTNSSRVKLFVKLKSKASLQTFITNISSASLKLVMMDKPYNAHRESFC